MSHNCLTNCYTSNQNKRMSQRRTKWQWLWKCVFLWKYAWMSKCVWLSKHFWVWKCIQLSKSVEFQYVSATAAAILKLYQINFVKRKLAHVYEILFQKILTKRFCSLRTMFCTRVRTLIIMNYFYLFSSSSFPFSSGVGFGHLVGSRIFCPNSYFVSSAYS